MGIYLLERSQKSIISVLVQIVGICLNFFSRIDFQENTKIPSSIRKVMATVCWSVHRIILTLKKVERFIPRSIWKYFKIFVISSEGCNDPHLGGW